MPEPQVMTTAGPIEPVTDVPFKHGSQLTNLDPRDGLF